MKKEYLGPVDGHNMRQMMKLFNEAKRVEGPVIVHVLTKKGKAMVQFSPEEKAEVSFLYG